MCEVHFSGLAAALLKRLRPISGTEPFLRRTHVPANLPGVHASWLTLSARPGFKAIHHGSPRIRATTSGMIIPVANAAGRNASHST